MTIDLSNKVALVTGGSKGIGLGAARALAEAGAKVYICARDLEELEHAVDSVSGQVESPIKAVEADITRQEDVDALIETIREQCGGVDILVNNVGGTGRPLEFEQLDADDFLSLYNLNVVTMVRMVQAVVPYMKSRRWGRIINISSENGMQPYPDMISYNLTKAAILSFTKGISRIYGRDNILVNAVSPAFIDTPLVQKMLNTQAAESGISAEEAARRFLNEKRPGIDLGRPGSIEEVGAAVAFLASEQASFIHGSNLRVDGGSVSCI